VYGLLENDVDVSKLVGVEMKCF